MSLVYRGTSSDDVKFNVTERRVYNAPAFDVSGIEVPGRSGDILNSQERFKNKAIVYTGFIRSSDFPGDTTWERLSRGLRTIKAWVCGDAGKYHDLTDDYDPGFVRRAFVSGETAISEVLDRPDGATITITFMAEPFMYEESDPIELPETGTASGAIASFEGVAAPLQSLKFNIEPSQNLHGYSYPWPAGGGKNKLNPSFCIDRLNKGITSTVNANGSITLAGTYEGGRYWNSSDSLGLTLPAGTYTLSDHIQLEKSGGTKVSGTFTISEATTFVNALFVGWGSGASVNETLWPQLESGSQPTSWTPYSNICPISGWSQVDGYADGKNMWPLLNSYSKDSSGTLINNVAADLPAGHYVISCSGNIAGQAQFSFRREDSSAISTCTLSDSYKVGGRYARECTITEPVKRINFYSNNSIDISDIQMELIAGTTATGYETPNIRPITISLGQTVYGGTVDALNGKLILTHAYESLDGTGWTWDGNNGLVWHVVTGGVITNGTTQHNKYIKACNMFIPTSWARRTDDGDGTICMYYGQTRVAVKWSKITSASDAATLFNDTPLQVVYELATPIEVDLTPVSVSSLLGQNNIWCNTGDTEVVYVEPTENPTEWPSKPRLEITMSGAGTLTVNGKTWSIGAYTGTLICDSEIMDWYDASNLKNSLVSGDGFPELQPGENVITYTGGITKVVAKPRWRTL